MLTLLKKIFTWWNRDTLGTRLKTILFGKFVGTDSLGNKYYESKNGKRWVIYSQEIDATKIELGVEGTEVSEGTVCFSKDGTYYSPGGDFIDDSSPIERLFICSKGSAAKCNEDGGENTFALAWSRFGNISLKKYSKKNIIRT